MQNTIINYVIAHLTHHYTYSTHKLTCLGHDEQECDELANNHCQYNEKHVPGVKKACILEKSPGTNADL